MLNHKGFKFWTILSAVFLLPLLNWAGEATLTGQGQVVVNPEFVTLSIRVTSECFKSAAGVSTSNDRVANEVLALVKGAAHPENGDEVTASGGYVQRYTGYNAITRKNICVNTFRKINNISLKTKANEHFVALFTELQDRLYALGMDASPSGSEQPTSFLEIGEPTLGLSFERQREYERQALLLALQNAKDKFQSTIAMAGVDQYKIVNYSEVPILNRGESDESRKLMPMPAPPVATAPVELGHLTISKLIYVRFEFTGGEIKILY